MTAERSCRIPLVSYIRNFLLCCKDSCQLLEVMEFAENVAFSRSSFTTLIWELDGIKLLANIAKNENESVRIHALKIAAKVFMDVGEERKAMDDFHSFLNVVASYGYYSRTYEVLGDLLVGRFSPNGVTINCLN